MLRVELSGASTEVFVGFRGESLSVYFGDDPVYHFNARGELRRAFVAGRLVKAEQGRLASLDRRPSPEVVALVRSDLDPTHQAALLREAESRLLGLRLALAARRASLVGQVPEAGDAIARLRAWLEEHPAITVAKSPRVGG